MLLGNFCHFRQGLPGSHRPGRVIGIGNKNKFGLRCNRSPYSFRVQLEIVLQPAGDFHRHSRLPGSPPPGKKQSMASG